MTPKYGLFLVDMLIIVDQSVNKPMVFSSFWVDIMGKKLELTKFLMAVYFINVGNRLDLMKLFWVRVSPLMEIRAGIFYLPPSHSIY